MSAQEKYPYYPADQPVPETPDPGSPPKPWGKTTMVGKRQPRVDGYELVSGRAVYPSDVSLPGMLFGAVLRSPHPNAVVKARRYTRGRTDAGRARHPDGIEPRGEPLVDLWQRRQEQAFRSPLPLRGRGRRRRGRRDSLPGMGRPQGDQGRVRRPAAAGRRAEIAPGGRAARP